MRIPKLAKNLFTYLPVLAVLIATVLGLLVGEGLYPPSIESLPQTEILGGPGNPQLLIVPGAPGTCTGGLIFTSLPPKCKTLDGSFILANGTSPYVSLIPGGK